ncbi:murein transglycosylase A [Ideonella sp. BN130291]|uniref:murein transglycosylase A n=1 Tax=Ideonella sp. BN130291 TaxID=3112940 RepID=UPI002E27306E|nr:MltA domain-containing protein [Ideonella sp. BN130291]
MSLLSIRAPAGAAGALILGSALALLAACASDPGPRTPPPIEDRLPGKPGAATAPVAPPAEGVARGRGRWVPSSYAELPGWTADSVRDTWTALLRSCDKPAPGFVAFCEQARHAPAADDSFLREWLMQRLQPYRIESAEGQAEGLITGYFEPLVDAARKPQGSFRIPLHAAPADLATRKPYWTRQQLDSLPAAQAALRGREIAWLNDPLDLLVLQIQGSGRLRFADGGRTEVVRVAYAGHNDQPYKSVGRWLIDQGELRADHASWPAIREWARRNPRRVNELLWANPRVVFFREEPLPDPQLGPRGAQGVPLTPGRSIAVDPQSVPYGTPVWIATTEPLSATPLQRLVVAQDTGSAIVGAVRADYFWGWGDEAENQAGRMKQPLRMWALWPVMSAPGR